MALGALPSQIRTRFLAQGAGISLLGCIAGLAIAAAFSRLLAGILYDVSRLDALTYIAALLAYSSLPPPLPRSQPRALHISIRWKSYGTNNGRSAPLGGRITKISPSTSSSVDT
jgi:ABC-type lipoprotein release transport system permease subunit